MKLFKILIFVLFTVKLCIASTQKEIINPGFQGSQMDYIDNNGFFLLSNNSNFAFGFITLSSSTDSTSYLLAVVYQPSSLTVWTANRNSPINHSDDFIFGKDGNAYLKSGDYTVWSSNTSRKGAVSMKLLDSGNLVILGSDSSSSPIWQSFSNPTDTILSGQSFTEGTILTSQPNSQNITYHLSMDSGDIMLYLDFSPPQPYWSMKQDERKITNKMNGELNSAIITNNSWTFYDKTGSVLWEFEFITGQQSDGAATWAAILNNHGIISFTRLGNGGTSSTSTVKIPRDSCDTPDSCNPYFICYTDTSRCQCPRVLDKDSDCNPNILSSCGSSSSSSYSLARVDDGVGYFATKFVSPFSQTNLTGCQDVCMSNCSCVALFYDNDSQNCFVFSQIASFKQLDPNNTSYSSFIKVSMDTKNESKVGQTGKHQFVVILGISIGAVILISIFLTIGFLIHRKKTVRVLETEPEPSQGGSSDNDSSFFDLMSTMPIRFSYKELESATNNFSTKLGQGGFGSVYLGTLRNGSRIAVKKLEGIGQGKKEFRSEVTIIGSIHHIHLVKLHGFCTEGSHRLLAYEYMPNGSLEKWIFNKDNNNNKLDWNKRFEIALGTAKGLAYLHQDCDSKIVHCDIKPENVLLDENFLAKVSDFGLAKLMNREQSHVFTTLRGTRGYLAPEWITNYAISEKSDVYSYGMVLLEIIGGRKNFEPSYSSEKAHFPSFAFKKFEEGKLKEVLDERLRFDDEDERVEIAVKVALWCVQEDLNLRPSMTRVVQMLEGFLDVPKPPLGGPNVGFRLYANVFKEIGSSSEEGVTISQSECNSDAFLSAVRLSGPR